MTYFTLEIFTEARVLEKDSTDVRVEQSASTASSIISYQSPIHRAQFADALNSLYAFLKLQNHATKLSVSLVQQNKAFSMPVQ